VLLCRDQPGRPSPGPVLRGEAPELAQLLALVAGQAIIALAAVMFLATPVAERLLGHAVALRKLARRAPSAQHLHHLAAELLG
jgi:multisubunit Na+/H+ antiporter MnhG subunit